MKQRDEKKAKTESLCDTGKRSRIQLRQSRCDSNKMRRFGSNSSSHDKAIKIPARISNKERENKMYKY